MWITQLFIVEKSDQLLGHLVDENDKNSCFNYEEFTRVCV